MSAIYYTIKKRHEDNIYFEYISGSTSSYEWKLNIRSARRFRTIGEIRSFITSSLKYKYNDRNVNNWIFERHSPCIISHNDIITPSHTMALLRVN
jgi:hypothetical protein